MARLRAAAHAFLAGGGRSGRGGGSAPADYSNVTDDQLKATVDSAKKIRGMLKESGLDSGYPPQEAPETPDLGVYEQARHQSSLAGLVHGFTGAQTVTPYGVAHGQRAGQVSDSPAWKAVQDEASLPWDMEQRRVGGANQLHAFVNQYAQLKAGTSDKNKQQAFDLARENAIMNAYSGAQNNQLEMMREERRRSDDRYANTLAHQQRMEDLANRSSDRKDMPNQAEHSEYTHATGAKVALNNMKKIIESNPDIKNLANGLQFSWGEMRKNTSPAANALLRQRDLALDHIVQMQRRMTVRGGGGAQTIASALGKFGDDKAVDMQLLDQFLAQADMTREYVKRTRPNFDYEGLDSETFDRTEKEAGDPGLGGGAKAPDAIDKELERRGWK